jgi:hypothetical protein
MTFAASLIPGLDEFVKHGDQSEPRARPGHCESSLRANGSRECAPDDRLREAIQNSLQEKTGLLRYARNDGGTSTLSHWQR